MSKTFVVSLTAAIDKFWEDANKTLTRSGSLFRLSRRDAERAMYAKFKDLLEYRTENLPPDFKRGRYEEFINGLPYAGTVESTSLPVASSSFYLARIMDMTVGKKTHHLWTFNRFGDDVLMRRSVTVSQFYVYRSMQEASNVRKEDATTRRQRITHGADRSS